MRWPQKLQTCTWRAENDAKWLETALGIKPNPRGEFSFRNVARGQAEDCLNGFCLWRDEFVAVDRQENADGVERGAFVSVHERMILG